MSRILKSMRFKLARSSEERREAEKGSSIKYVGKLGSERWAAGRKTEETPN